MKKNLFNIDLDKSSDIYGSQSLKACDPCAAECKKINKKINDRKLSDIKDNSNLHDYFDDENSIWLKPGLDSTTKLILCTTTLSIAY